MLFSTCLVVKSNQLENGEVFMRKSTLFISVVLTTFVLAVLFGVVSNQKALQNAQTETVQTQTVAPTEQLTEVPAADQLISLAPTNIVDPEQAAVLAAQTLGHNDVYSVESTTYEGVAAYLVTFSSGDLVYVSPAGQILAITQPEPVVVVINKPGRDPDRDRPARDSGGGEDGDEDHNEEDHGEHEEHED
jgi:hypothetical protein